MKSKVLIASLCIFASSCGSDDPITIEEISEEPDRKDIAMLCDLFRERSKNAPDKIAEGGFQDLVRLGVSEKGIKKAAAARKKGRAAYVEGISECCKAFNKEVKDLDDTQIAYVYADLVLSGITSDMLTPAQQRDARALREYAEDNMTRPASNTAYDVRTSLPKCTKEFRDAASRETTEAIRQIVDDYR
ncbi:MAG: hypothetical protein ACFBZ9_05235 [Sphingomonadales bacterium]